MHPKPLKRSKDLANQGQIWFKRRMDVSSQNTKNTSSPKVLVELTHDEALIFFDWLARDEDSQMDTPSHESEQVVLLKIEGQLEQLLIEPFDEDYTERLEAARDRILLGE